MTAAEAAPAPGAPSAEGTAAERASDMDTLVSQAAEGPFEPPVDPLADEAPNGTVAAQQDGGVRADEEPGTA